MAKRIIYTPAKRTPRKKKKGIKNSRIIYDVNTLPNNKGLSMEGVMMIWEEYGVLLYDGSKGQRPIIVANHKYKKLKLINVA